MPHLFEHALLQLSPVLLRPAFSCQATARRRSRHILRLTGAIDYNALSMMAAESSLHHFHGGLRQAARQDRHTAGAGVEH
jgi:acetolactate synthase-1/2/3 large subunit